jgi:cytoskeletal protein RodZ
MDSRSTTLGAILRRRRMDRRLSLADVADQLHVPTRHIQALEADDFAPLPPTVYTRALIREYAHLLGLTPAEVTGYSVPMRMQDRHPIRPAIAPLDRQPLVSWKAISTVAVVTMCTGLFLYLYVQYNSFAQGVEAGQTPAGANASESQLVRLLTPLPTPTLPPTITPVPSPTTIAGVHVEVRAVERSWVQAWTDERPSLAEDVPAGASRVLIGDASVRMRVGNAGGLDVTVNGTPQGRLGTTGQALEVSWAREQR